MSRCGTFFQKLKNPKSESILVISTAQSTYSVSCFLQNLEGFSHFQPFSAGIVGSEFAYQNFYQKLLTPSGREKKILCLPSNRYFMKQPRIKKLFNTRQRTLTFSHTPKLYKMILTSSALEQLPNAGFNVCDVK